MSDILWFFGAGASKPFGIPTMQEMVTEFKEDLVKSEDKDRIGLFNDIWSFLAENLDRPIDLEAVFTIVDSITDWSSEKIGISALYHATRCANIEMKNEKQKATIRLIEPNSDKIDIARKLKIDFEEYIRRKCEDHPENNEKIKKIYGELFAIVGRRHEGVRNESGLFSGPWSIFTTNYDNIIEGYFLDIAKCPLITGFEYNGTTRMHTSTPEAFQRHTGPTKLFKLHGSTSWYRHPDPDVGIVELELKPQGNRTRDGREFGGQVMLYPIVEKELYHEPFISMYHELVKTLKSTKYWLVIGYSFGDKIVRDIFINNSLKTTKMVLWHPHAKQIAVEKLKMFKGKIEPFDQRFGLDSHRQFCEQLDQFLE